jgi:hypothetical protein
MRVLGELCKPLTCTAGEILAKQGDLAGQLHFFFSLLLSSLELCDSTIYAP